MDTRQKVILYDIKQENDVNRRIYGRNLPSMMIQPELDLRPVSTKYTHFQLGDERSKPTEHIHHYPAYSTEHIFNPGNRRPPFHYFAKNVDLESILRNQTEKLTREQASKSLFINQKIHQHDVEAKNKTSEPDYQNIDMNRMNIDRLNLAPMMFNNMTRINIKNNDTR